MNCITERHFRDATTADGLRRVDAMNGKLPRVLAVFSAVALLLAVSARVAHCNEAAFAHRGYYFTFCRMPEYGLAEWKDIVDCVVEDRGNTMILWVGGAFRSKAYP